MRKIEQIETVINELDLYYFDEEKDELVKITDNSKVTAKQMQSAICFLVDEIKRTVNEDLLSIWRRLDELEERIK